jgi:hypothetical protein
MEKVAQGQLRRWIDDGFADESGTLFLIVSVSHLFEGEDLKMDVASVISCSGGMDEYILKISVDYIERNSVLFA